MLKPQSHRVLRFCLCYVRGPGITCFQTIPQKKNETAFSRMKSHQQNSSNTFSYKSTYSFRMKSLHGELRILWESTNDFWGIVKNLLGFHVHLRVCRLVASWKYMHVCVYTYIESDATAEDAQRRTLTWRTTRGKNTDQTRLKVEHVLCRACVCVCVCVCV